MTTIEYLKGDATQPAAEGAMIIAHICNDRGAWGKGFVLAISARWPDPERAYRKWRAENVPKFELGAIQVVTVEPNLSVANMVAQRGIRASKAGPPIRYDALGRCLHSLSEEAQLRSASVHMPRIGCGLAGGEWARVEELVAEALCENGVQVFVYDFE